MHALVYSDEHATAHMAVAAEQNGSFYRHSKAKVQTGSQVSALRAGDNSTYWAGEFSVPLTVDERDTIAPAKYWWRLSGD